MRDREERIEARSVQRREPPREIQQRSDQKEAAKPGFEDPAEAVANVVGEQEKYQHDHDDILLVQAGLDDRRVEVRPRQGIDAREDEHSEEDAKAVLPRDRETSYDERCASGSGLEPGGRGTTERGNRDQSEADNSDIGAQKPLLLARRPDTLAHQGLNLRSESLVRSR